MSSTPGHAIGKDFPLADYRCENEIPGNIGRIHDTRISSFGWQGVTVTSGAKEYKNHNDVIHDVYGFVKCGEMLAIMGPALSGKSTLLSALADQRPPRKTSMAGSIIINGNVLTDSSTIRYARAYVRQYHSLVGSLTVRETLEFAAKLATPSLDSTERNLRVDKLLKDFALTEKADCLIGTPIRAGISRGERKRLDIASRLITLPRILLLDDPTVGLDSKAALEVIHLLDDIAEREKIIIVASINQPSMEIYNLFDRLLLLSHGRTAYSGPIEKVGRYFDGHQNPIRPDVNPAEFVIDWTNTDFKHDGTKRQDQIHEDWECSVHARTARDELNNAMAECVIGGSERLQFSRDDGPRRFVHFALLHRMFIKSYRDAVAYWIRIATSLALAMLMGTVWLRLEPSQDNIQHFNTAISFGQAFLASMALAYIPSFLEDRAVFYQDRDDGLYGPASFLAANFLLGVPYLFFITLLFSTIVYWLCNFRPSAEAFWTWVMWIFLDLLASESLTILITSLLPNFVIALATTAFVNALCMCTAGFLVVPRSLNPFWRYTLYYIDYQAYVFRGLMVNEFSLRNYTCSGAPGVDCSCMFASSLSEECLIEGEAILKANGYSGSPTGGWVVGLLGIIIAYRILAWIVLTVKKT